MLMSPTESPADSEDDALLAGLAHLAAHTIRAALDAHRAPLLELPSAADAVGGCFVTLHQEQRLRGCIGTIDPHRSIRDDIEANAMAAAFRDPRFPPLTAQELASTTVEISILSPRRPLAFRDESDLYAQLRPGIDGVVVAYGGRRAIYLPEVWLQIPEPPSFIHSLRRKGGIADGVPTTMLEVERYTSRHSRAYDILSITTAT